MIYEGKPVKDGGFDLQQYGDELLQEMQDPDVRAATDKAFHASPDEYDRIIDGTDASDTPEPKT